MRTDTHLLLSEDNGHFASYQIEMEEDSKCGSCNLTINFDFVGQRNNSKTNNIRRTINKICMLA
jgi:hypothetical protein